MRLPALLVPVLLAGCEPDEGLALRPDETAVLADTDSGDTADTASGDTASGDTADTDLGPCVFAGQLREGCEDADWSGQGIFDWRPHPWLVDGRPTLLADTGYYLRWYDLADALDGTWTTVGEVFTDGHDGITVSSLRDLPDIEGDGQADFVAGGDRYATLPSLLDREQTALAFETGGIAATASDFDEDGIDDLVVSWEDDARVGSIVGWVPSTTTGTWADPELATVAALPVWEDARSSCWDYCGPGVFERFDANGDGQDEVLIPFDAFGSTYGEFWHTSGAGFVVEGTPSASSVEAVAMASILGQESAGVTGLTVTGDLDGDGYDDIVGAFEDFDVSEGYVGVFPGPFVDTRTGDDAYTRIEARHTSGFAAGDVDGDGALELFFQGGWCPEGENGAFVFPDPMAGGRQADATIWVCSEAYVWDGVPHDMVDVSGDGLADLVGFAVFLAR